MKDKQDAGVRTTPASAVPAGPPRIDSAALFSGRNEIIIAHQGRDYRLRLTAHGKLILTA